MPYPGIARANAHLNLHCLRMVVTAAQLAANAGVVRMGTLPNGAVVVRCTSSVQTAFTAGAALSVGTNLNSKTGTAAAASAFQAAGAGAGQLNAPTAGIYAFIPMYDMPDDQDVIVTATGAPAVGSVEILVEFYPHVS